MTREFRHVFASRYALAVGSAECMRGTIASETSDIVFNFSLDSC